MNDHNLSPAEWDELAGIYDTCRFHNTSFYAGRTLMYVANRLFELGYVDRMTSTTGKYKYRPTRRGIEAIKIRRGES